MPFYLSLIGRTDQKQTAVGKNTMTHHKLEKWDLNFYVRLLENINLFDSGMNTYV